MKKINNSDEEMMDFSKKNDEELNTLSQDYYKKYGKFIEDKSLSLKDKDLTALFKKNKISDVNKEKDELYSFIKESLFRQLKTIALVEYLIMEKSKDFDVMGEQRVSISFCRNLLNIPNDREVTQFDADRFRRLVEEFDEKNGKKGVEGYQNWRREYDLDFLGIKVNARSLSQLKEYLNLINLPYYFYVSYASKGVINMIFGEVEKKQIGAISVFIVGKEFIRTPNLVLSVAAKGSEDNSLLIRRESCEVIFFNKWQRFFDQSKYDFKKALNHYNSAIREGVKAKALSIYKVKNSEEVKKIKDIFIDEMIDGILWHEIGHIIADESEGALYRAMNYAFVRTDTIIGVINECMGDWAPEKGSIKGALERFEEIAVKDKDKALRCIYVYLSDNWFIDEEEEFMALQTDILTALILHFIEKDGSFNFEKLHKEKRQIFDFLEKYHKKLLDQLFLIIKQGNYTIGLHKVNYETLEKEVLKLYKDQVLLNSVDEMYKKPNFWVNLMGYVRKFSPETLKKIDEYIEMSGTDLRRSILKIITKGEGDKYNNSLREYVYARYKEIGILKEKNDVDHDKAIDVACNSMKMPEKIKNKVIEQVAKIIKGENYDISINYEGEKDPFLAVIQEMMIKSGYGDIKAGMFLGEMYDAEEPIEKRKEYIKNELENIRDQIESEMYMDVDKLRVNKKYNVKPMVEELLETVAFFDSKKLKDKIKEVVYEDFTSDALFEVLIPLKRGFMDWNTSQAVWRINQDLRPDEFIMQWTIDKDFLEALIEAYL